MLRLFVTLALFSLLACTRGPAPSLQSYVDAISPKPFDDPELKAAMAQGPERAEEPQLIPAPAPYTLEQAFGKMPSVKTAPSKSKEPSKPAVAKPSVTHQAATEGAAPEDASGPIQPALD